MSGGIMLRKGHWTAVIKVRGRQKWRAARTREEAQLLLGRLREDAARERIGLPKVERETLASFAPVYLKWAKSRKDSWERDERSLKPLLVAFGHLRLKEITIARVQDYMQERLKTETLQSATSRKAFEQAKKDKRVPPEATPPEVKTLSKASVNREVACLRGLLFHAVKSGSLERNPIEGISLMPEEIGRTPVVSQDEEERLINALPEWMRLIYRLAVMTGCRRGEILALTWKDVDLDQEPPILSVAKSKSGLPRHVPIHPVLLDELRAQRARAEERLKGQKDEMTARRDLADSPVVTHANGRPPRPAAVTNAFKRAAVGVGRPDMRWHDTRHLAASRLLETGASLPEVAAATGHKTLHMAKRYAHVNPVRLASLMADMRTPGTADKKPAAKKTTRLRKAPVSINRKR